MKAKRRIKDARITHVSLCKAGKNRLPVLFKSDGDDGPVIEVTPLVKYEESRGQMVALVTVPEHVDSDGDVSGVEVVEKMCHGWAQQGSQVDLNHDLKPIPRDKVFVAENYIVQKGDPRFEGWLDRDGNPVDATGGWAQIYQFEDPELRAAAAAGEIAGVSMYGPAHVEELQKSDIDAALEELKKALSNSAGTSTTPSTTTSQSADVREDDLDMTLEEFKALLAENNDRLLAKMDEKVATLRKSKESTDSDSDGDESNAPAVELEFEGDRSNPEDLLAHARRVEIAKLEAATDFSDPASIAKLAKALSGEDEYDEEDQPRRKTKKLAKSNTERELSLLEEDTLSKAEFLSPTIDGTLSGAMLSKADMESAALGRLMAKEFNDQVREGRKGFPGI